MLRVFILLAGLLTVARATTVIPPTFDELVASSELVFRGRVTAVGSFLKERSGRSQIATRVTFAVERTLRGEAGATLTLEFLGGAIGDKELVLAGWPTFAVGDRGVFFVENRHGTLCPLVRLRHGRYRIIAGAKATAERVVRDDFTPLPATAFVAMPLAGTTATPGGAPASGSMTLGQFESQVLARSADLPRREVLER